MPKAAKVDDFVKRSVWVGILSSLMYTHIHGLISNVTRSEVVLPILMYLFLALMESVEQATLIFPDKDEWRLRFLFVFWLKCFPERGEHTRGDSDGRSGNNNAGVQSTSASQNSQEHHAASRQTGTSAQRLRDLEYTIIHGARFGSFHRREIENIHADLLREQPCFFFELILRIHRSRKSHGHRLSSLEKYIRDIRDPKPGDPHHLKKREVYANLLIHLRRQELKHACMAGETLTTIGKTLQQQIAQYDALYVEVDQLRKRPRQPPTTTRAHGNSQRYFSLGSSLEAEEDNSIDPVLSEAVTDGGGAHLVRGRCRCCCCCCVSRQHYDAKVADAELLANKEDELKIKKQTLVAILDRDLMRSSTNPKSLVSFNRRESIASMGGRQTRCRTNSVDVSETHAENAGDGGHASHTVSARSELCLLSKRIKHQSNP